MRHIGFSSEPSGLARAPDAAGGAEPGLPSWDLADLYPALDSPAVEADLAAAETAARNFATAYPGRLATMPGAESAIGSRSAVA